MSQDLFEDALTQLRRPSCRVTHIARPDLGTPCERELAQLRELCSTASIREADICDTSTGLTADSPPLQLLNGLPGLQAQCQQDVQVRTDRVRLRIADEHGALQL